MDTNKPFHPFAPAGLTPEQASTLDDGFKVVKIFREMMEPLGYPTPNYFQCLAFAATESGEAVDALLRTDPTFKRNDTDKVVSVEEEVADCFYMILSALYAARLVAFPKGMGQLLNVSETPTVLDLNATVAKAAALAQYEPAATPFGLRYSGHRLVEAACLIVIMQPTIAIDLRLRLQRLAERHANLTEIEL